MDHSEQGTALQALSCSRAAKVRILTKMDKSSDRLHFVMLFLDVGVMPRVRFYIKL